VRYLYTFTVWPDETKGFAVAMFELFRMLTSRVEMQFSCDEFRQFRANLARHGLTLREVERVPYCEPEPVT
jgi:hypothetical protein